MVLELSMKKYSRSSPYCAFLKKRESATGASSSRKTFHIVLDTTGWDETYKVGDSIGVLPANNPKEVSDILHLLGTKGDEVVLDPRSGDVSIHDFLMFKANIMRINRSLVSCSVEKGGVSRDLLDSENKEELTQFLHTHTLKELASLSPITKEEIAKYAMPMLPRFYSIASAAQAFSNELHLLVASVQYQVNGQERYGVGSYFLGMQAEIGSTLIPIYVQPSNHFTLPEDPRTSMIMIGPGTGVAPYRAFVQERIATHATGRNWLFFGERNQKTDFYYESFWTDLEKQGLLRLDTAFSRDQEEKVYVQHKMYERRKSLWQWIQEGAFVYVCGDAKQMAKEVEATLCQIIREEGTLTEAEALIYFRKMRKEKRYMADVY